jgi:hypothetical protein
MTDLIRDDDLVKRLPKILRQIATFGAVTPDDVAMIEKSADHLEALQAEVERLQEFFHVATEVYNSETARLRTDADRRVEEEMLAIVADERNRWLYNTNLACDQIEAAIRSRSTREQVSDSSTACSTAAAPISQEQGEIAATRLSEGELAALDRLRLAARVLLQNSEGCALEHYGHDYGLLGMPGWLADCERDIKQAEAVLSHLRAQRSPSAVSEDVNPNVSIAPEALSEGGEV